MTDAPAEPPVKVGERLARQIIDEIAAAGWPIGEVLGTEPELIERYGVSRPAFREAVRILEHLDSARMREGRGGGLVVTEPRPGPLTHAAAIYLRYRRVDIHDLYSARLSLEVDLVERATRAMDADREAALRAVLADELSEAPDDLLHHTSDLHLAIARAADNEPLALFLHTAISLSDEYSRPKVTRSAKAMGPRRQESHRAHEAIVDAMVAGDVETAVRRMRSHLTAVADWMPR